MQPNTFMTNSFGYLIKIHTNFFVTPKLDANSNNLKDDPIHFYTNTQYRAQIQVEAQSKKDSIYRELRLLDQGLTLFTKPIEHVKSNYVKHLYEHMLLSQQNFDNNIHFKMINNANTVVISFIHPITGYLFDFEIPRDYIDTQISDNFIYQINADKTKHLKILTDKIGIKHISKFEWSDEKDTERN